MWKAWKLEGVGSWAIFQWTSWKGWAKFSIRCLNHALIFQFPIYSGQTITTLAEVTLNGGLVREFPPKSLNSGLGISNSTSQTNLCAVAMSSSFASRPANLVFSEDEKHRLSGLAGEEYDPQYSQFWREEIIFTAFNLMRMQSAREAEVDESIEGILAECRSQIVLETWNNNFWESDLFRKIVQISDDGFGFLRDGESAMPLEGEMIQFDEHIFSDGLKPPTREPTSQYIR